MTTTRWAVLAVLLGVLLGSSTAAYRFLGTTSDEGADLAGLDPEHEGRLGALPPARPDQPQPEVLVAEPVYNFGTMERFGPGSHPFVITNEGDYPLEIEYLASSCACTAARLKKGEKVVIGPGKSYEFMVEWHANTRRSEFRQAVTVATTDPRRPRLDLTVTGKVVQAYEVRPNDLILGQFQRGREKTAQVEILNFTEKPLEIVGHSLSDPQTTEYLDVEILPAPPAKLSDPSAAGGAIIRLTARPGLPLGSVNQILTLKTNLPDYPEMRVPVYGLVSGAIDVFGQFWIVDRSVLALGEFNSSDGVKRKLTLNVKGMPADEIELKLTKVFPEVLQVSFGPKRVVRAGDDPVVHVPLVVEVPKGAKPANFLSWRPTEMGQILIETNHPEAPQVRLWVRFAVIP